jgi:DNA-binding IclR family transcriptional regulator
VLRATAILNLLAAHPTQSFTMTDIVKALRLNRATCHAILAALVEADYLYRASDKSYLLGPALHRIARAAGDKVSPLQAAGPEMRMLADAYDAVCSATFLEKGEFVARERAASASHLDWAMAPSRRYPARAPMGGVFMAWSTKGEIKRWLENIGQSTKEEQFHLLEALKFPHRHGYSVGLRKSGFGDFTALDQSEHRLSQTEYIVEDIKPQQNYAVAFLSAPVFDNRSRVAFALVLTGLSEPVSGAKVEAIGKMLRASCDRITSSIGGVIPPMTRATTA